MLNTILIILSFFAGYSQAQDLNPCLASDIMTLKRPFIHNRPKLGKFDYLFRYRKSVDQTQPLVILLGGGPGDALISLSRGKDFYLSGVPANYNVIYTDQRGQGCNAGVFPDEAFTTLELAYDVLAIVQHLEKLQGKPLRYFLYGASYGTVHATVFTHLAEKTGTTPPQALVLEGVVGHAFGDFQNYFKEFEREWKRVKSFDLSLQVQQFFAGPLPSFSSDLGYSSRVWGDFVSTQLILGYTLYQSPVNKKWGFRHLIDYYFSDPVGQKALAQQLLQSWLATADGAITPSIPIFSNLACRELFNGFYLLRDIKNGELVPSGENLCKVPMSRPYNSARYLIKTPIYYFQSPHDPTSTLAQATYHFDKQIRSTRRSFVTVERASHAPLTFGLGFCAPMLWENITKQPQHFEAAITACRQYGLTTITLQVR